MRLSNITDIPQKITSQLRQSKVVHPLLRKILYSPLIVKLFTYFHHVQPELVNHSTGAFAEEALQGTSSATIHFWKAATARSLRGHDESKTLGSWQIDKRQKVIPRCQKVQAHADMES